MAATKYVKTPFSKEGEARSPEIIRHDDGAEIQDLTSDMLAGIITKTENEVRVFCTQAPMGEYPGAFSFQLRVKKPMVRGGKERFMIATCSVTVADMEAVLAYMKGYGDRPV